MKTLNGIPKPSMAWNTAAALNLVSGNGTLNYMTKWSPDGNTIANSQVFDNGTNIGIGTTTPTARMNIEHTPTGTGAVRVNQPNELLIPAIKSLNGAITVDAAAAFPAAIGTDAIYAQRGDWTSGTVTTSVLNETGVFGFAPTGTGVQGISVTGRGVTAFATNGVGLRAFSQTGRAIESNGALQFANIGEANGRVLASDAAGNATWQDLITPKVHMSAGSCAGQAIVGATTIINGWGNLDEAGGANFTPATGTYTIPVTGYYTISLHLAWGNTASVSGASEVKCKIIRNGATIAQGYSNETIAGDFPSDPDTEIGITLNAGDTIQFAAEQNTGGALSIQGGDRWCKFQLHLVHK